MREKILDELERLTALRGGYTMVDDLCSAEIVSRSIRALYRKLETAVSMREYVLSLTDRQLRPVYEIERDRALRYQGTDREAGAERDYRTVRAEMLRRNLLGGDNDPQTR